MFKVGDKLLVEAEVKAFDNCYTLLSLENESHWFLNHSIKPITSQDIPWQPTPTDRKVPENGDYLVIRKNGSLVLLHGLETGAIFLNGTSHIAKVSFNRPPQRVTESITCSPETMAKINALLQEETCSK